MKIDTGIWLDNNIYHIQHELHRVFENHDIKCHYPVMKMRKNNVQTERTIPCSYLMTSTAV